MSFNCPLNIVFSPFVPLQAPTQDTREPRAARVVLAPSRTASCCGWTAPPGTRAVCGVPPASSHWLPPAGAEAPNCTAEAITSGKTHSSGPFLSPDPTIPGLSLSVGPPSSPGPLLSTDPSTSPRLSLSPGPLLSPSPLVQNFH